MKNEIRRTLWNNEILNNLSIKELDLLAIEIREFLIEKISHTGGHIGANLGVVELTIVQCQI